jgi:N-acetylglucosamine-6-phosphate deacetylase
MNDISMRARAFIGGHLHDDVSIRVADGRIASLIIHHPSVRQHSEVVIPGLIDLHVHGAAGADFMDGTDEALRRVVEFHATQGTAALAATTLSGSRASIEVALRVIDGWKGSDRAAEIAAVHLEGPYISLQRAGAQDRSSIRLPSIHELQDFRSLVPRLPWIVTVAPELEGAMTVIEHFRGEITFSIGHTDASYGIAAQALGLGASHFTHLFNAMPPLLHREPGPVAAAFDSLDATVELIADGIHVHPAILRFVARSMPSRTVLVTDAMRACGMGPGTYRLHDYDVVVSEGAARLEDGTLAGSTLTMIGAVRNMIELAGVPLESVIPLATEIPARVIGLAGRKGKIEEGYDADLLLLSEKLQLQRVLVRGREIETG